jgi:hypothetical protein
MLDNLPPEWRHAALMLLAVLMAWASESLIPLLYGHGGLSAALGTALAAAIAIFTPITRQYGVGAPAADVDTGEHVA